jgi:hypothetical protein
MAISVAALRHMLPTRAADVLQAREFRLVQVCWQAMITQRGTLRQTRRLGACVPAAQQAWHICSAASLRMTCFPALAWGCCSLESIADNPAPRVLTNLPSCTMASLQSLALMVNLNVILCRGLCIWVFQNSLCVRRN